MLGKDYMLIKIVKRFKPLIEKTGINFWQFVSILQLKLTLDDRKTSLQESMGNKSKLTGTQQNLLVLGFVGLFSGMLMPMPLDLYYKVASLAGINLFFLVMYMVSDFSSVLLDVRDSTLIMTKPVDAKTMNAARIVHITYYMMTMFAALNAISLVLGTVAHGPMFAVSLLITMFFLSFLIVFLTTILYSLLLKFFSGEKLKDVLNLFQIVLSVITVVAYQVLARMFEFVDMNLTINIKWWSYLLPPTWFAGLFKILVEGDTQVAFILMAVLAIVVPILLGIVLKTWILPKYESYLTKLGVEGQLKEKRRGPIRTLKEAVMKALSKDHVEFAFMQFTDANLSRDRRLKLMVYPNHALGMLFPFIMLFSMTRSHESIGAALTSLSGSSYYLALYFSVMFLVTNFDFLKFSSNADAASIYKSLPVENMALFYRAAVKAYYLKFAFPTMLALSVLFMLVIGPSGYLGILVVNVMVPLLLILKGFVVGLFCPFATPFGTTGNKNLAATFAMMFVCGAVTGVHYVTTKIHFLAPAVLLVLCVVLCKTFSYGLLKKKLVL
ncbi:hypothetical protein ACR6HW_12415 [Fusibacter sp. JL298sf-3]